MVAPEMGPEVTMRAKFALVLAVAMASLLVVAAIGAKLTLSATQAAAAETTGARISPRATVVAMNMEKLPLEEFRDGECPDRC
jgi:hypothetical protein